MKMTRLIHALLVCAVSPFLFCSGAIAIAILFPVTWGEAATISGLWTLALSWWALEGL